MAHPPFFSIIVPVYNVSEYLRRCLDSISNQTFNDFECLLIDDGSTDDSSAICKEYAERDERFHFFQKENGGVSTARNLGLKHARGTWICFVDSDDYVENEYLGGFHRLSDMGDLLCQGIICCSIEDGRKYVSVLQKQYVTRNDFAVPLIKMYGSLIYYYLMLKAFRRDIIVNNNIYFDEALKRRQDEMFINKYIRNINSINIGSECNYNYFFTTAEKYNSFSSIYDKLAFNISSITYYCLYSFCREESDFFLLTRIAGTRLLGTIFSSYQKSSKYRKKKEILFVKKYITPFKNNVAIAHGIRWRIFSPLICSKKYFLIIIGLRLYVATMRRHNNR